MQRDNKYYLPPMDYFISKNCASGNIDEFNYKVVPKEMLKVSVWYGKLCSEKSETEVETEFAISEEGLDQVALWLEEQRQIYLKKCWELKQRF